MSVVTDLQEARELILKEEHWIQEYSAKDKFDMSCSPWNPAACKWCATGALDKVVYEAVETRSWTRYNKARVFLNDAAHEMGSTGCITVNDELGHKATIEMFDKAIERAKDASS